MRLRTTTILLVCMFMPLILAAQTLTNKERRAINSKLLTLIEDYERYASLYDDDAEYYFYELFDDNAEVVSDMIGSPSYLQSISATQYISQLRTYSINTITTIKDVTKGAMRYEDGKWYIPVNFKKSISYIDANGYNFSIGDFYGTDFSVAMNVVYDEEEDRCLIASIDGSVDSDKEFPKGRFYIINKGDSYNRNNRYMETLQIGNTPLVYSELGQAYVAQGEPSVDDFDVKVTPEIVLQGYNYDVVSFSFKRRLLRLRPRFSFAPIMAYDVYNNNGLDVKSGAMEAGLDFGVTFPLGRKSKIGLYIGAGMSKSNLDLSYNSKTSVINYDYHILKYDEQSMAYGTDDLYRYTITGAKERIEYLDFCIPLYLDFEFSLGKHLLMSFNFGAKAYLNMSARAIYPYTVEYTRNGIESEFAPDSFIITNSYKKQPYDLSGIANLEFDVNLYDGRIYLMVGAGYERGFTDSYKSNNHTYLGWKYPILPELNADGSVSDVAALSLISGLSTKRNIIWFNAGLKFKL